MKYAYEVKKSIFKNVNECFEPFRPLYMYHTNIKNVFFYFFAILFIYCCADAAVVASARANSIAREKRFHGHSDRHRQSDRLVCPLLWPGIASQEGIRDETLDLASLEHSSSSTGIGTLTSGAAVSRSRKPRGTASVPLTV